MIRKTTCTLGFALLASVSVVPAGELKPSGRKIMEEVEDRNVLDDEITEIVTQVYKNFTIMGKRVRMNEKRRATNWSLRYARNHQAMISRFHTPKDLRNLSLLSYRDLRGYGKPYIAWQWDPEKKPPELKQVSGPLSIINRTTGWAGTDYTIEDMEPPDLDSCSYRHVRDEKLKNPHDKKLSGADCYVVEAYKKPGYRTGYFKRVTWVEKKRWLVLKVDFYAKRNRKRDKTLWLWDYVEAKPGVWRSNQSLMKYVSGKSWTRISVTKRKVNPGIPPWFFQPRVLRLTDAKSMRLVREMWSLWREVRALQNKVRDKKSELETIRSGKETPKPAGEAPPDRKPLSKQGKQ